MPFKLGAVSMGPLDLRFLEARGDRKEGEGVQESSMGRRGGREGPAQN